MPNRHGQGDDYRYGFNGMEMDDEVRNGKGNSYDFGARMLDPRIGRWLSTDPLEAMYPFINSYNFALNNPSNMIDPNGKEPRWGQLASIMRLWNEMKRAITDNDIGKATIEKQLEVMGSYFQADRKFKRVEGKLVDVDPKKNIGRYIYTEKRGWQHLNMRSDNET